MSRTNVMGTTAPPGSGAQRCAQAGEREHRIDSTADTAATTAARSSPLLSAYEGGAFRRRVSRDARPKPPRGRAMNAPVRKPLVAEEEVRADPVEVFRLRCHSRAKLWHTGQIDLHSAVDELQHSAEASGLIDAIGQDAVQGLMVEAFVPLRDDLPRAEKKEPPADDQYDGLSSTFAKLCREADEKQRRKLPDPRLERLRRLMADDVTLERAWHEINHPTDRAAASTVEALMLALRERGTAAQTEPNVERRLGASSESQLHEVCARL